MWSRFSMVALLRHNASLQVGRFALIFNQICHSCTVTTPNWSVSSTTCWKMQLGIVYSVKGKKPQSAQKSVCLLIPLMRQLCLLNQQVSHGSAFESSTMVRVCRRRSVSAFLSPFMHALMATALVWLFAKGLSMRIKDESGLRRQISTKEMSSLKDKMPILPLLALALSLRYRLMCMLRERCLPIGGILKEEEKRLLYSVFLPWRSCHESKGQTHSVYR